MLVSSYLLQLLSEIAYTSSPARGFYRPILVILIQVFLCRVHIVSNFGRYLTRMAVLSKCSFVLMDIKKFNVCCNFYRTKHVRRPT